MLLVYKGLSNISVSHISEYRTLTMWGSGFDVIPPNLISEAKEIKLHRHRYSTADGRNHKAMCADIIIIIIINCNWVVTRWQWLFYMHTKYEINY